MIIFYLIILMLSLYITYMLLTMGFNKSDFEVFFNNSKKKYFMILSTNILISFTIIKFII